MLHLSALSRIVIRIVDFLLAIPICASLGLLVPQKSVRLRIWQLACTVVEKSRLLTFSPIYGNVGI